MTWPRASQPWPGAGTRWSQPLSRRETWMRDPEIDRVADLNAAFRVLIHHKSAGLGTVGPHRSDREFAAATSVG